MPNQDLGDSASVFSSGPSCYATFGCSAIIGHGINTRMSPEAEIKLPISKIPYIVCVKTSKPDPTSTRKLASI